MLEHFIRIQLSKQKPPEEFPLHSEPLDGSPIDPPARQKPLPLGPGDDPFSTMEKARKLIERHKPRGKREC